MAMSSIPFTVVGGFLGSGKTTLLNHLLNTNDGRRIAVLVNDFGPVNIDARLIARHDGKTISLSNGCICCSIGSGLDAALIDVLSMNPLPEWIIVEASGISDPGPIADVALTESDLHIAGIVVLLDAENIVDQYTDPRLQDTVMRQIDGADLLVMNKADLVSETQLASHHKFFQRRYPGMPIINTTNASMPEELLLDLTSSVTERTTQRISRLPGTEELDHPFIHTAWQGAGVFSADKLMHALRSLPRTIVRAKGVVMTDYHGPAMVHFAGRRVQIQRISEPLIDQNHIVFIGLPTGLHAEQIHELISSCLITSSSP